jgi:sialate O-acetylesterase
MAITIDIGEPDNIHPKNKQEVGRRLSIWALGTVYGKSGATSGPLPAGNEIKGKTVVVTFQHTDGGLVAKGGELRGFQIAGAEKKWVPASAKISGSNVIVSSPEVLQPAAVRYAWANNPDCNLYNGADIPATPFRTDDWSETQ